MAVASVKNPLRLLRDSLDSHKADRHRLTLDIAALETERAAILDVLNCMREELDEHDKKIAVHMDNKLVYSEAVMEMEHMYASILAPSPSGDPLMPPPPPHTNGVNGVSGGDAGSDVRDFGDYDEYGQAIDPAVAQQQQQQQQRRQEQQDQQYQQQPPPAQQQRRQPPPNYPGGPSGAYAGYIE